MSAGPLKPVLYWMRQDFRTDDNPALHAAMRSGAPVFPVYIWDPDDRDIQSPGGASRWWLHWSLEKICRQLKQSGMNLIIRQGGEPEIIRELIRESGADSVFWNRRYEPALLLRDREIEKQLVSEGVNVRTFNSHLLAEPWEVQNLSGEPYKVFTPYWKKVKSTLEVSAKPFPGGFQNPKSKKLSSIQISDLNLLPQIPWDRQFYEHWSPGEEGAKTALKKFISGAAGTYEEHRNLPDRTGTSRLSPHLHFGEISVRRVYLELEKLIQKRLGSVKDIQVYQSELGWREFAYHILHHFPHTISKPLKPQFDSLGCRSDKKLFNAWKRGLTGYPIVDAGMRELWTIGWMHNRVRMVVASFLTKDLFIPWQDGAEWFRDTLVDADLASNTMGWQWTAGCGADAAPYFRIFNPVLQGEKFDSKGAYVRKWIPEISALPDKYIHKPWEAPEAVLEDAGVRLGKHYPGPVIDHFSAKKHALARYQKI